MPTWTGLRTGPRGRCLLVLALLGATASCAATTTRQRIMAERGRDVPCLRAQAVDGKVPFYQAVAVCHTPKPDLTGDAELQSKALSLNVPFTIRPKADAAIKAYTDGENIDTGSHLPGPHPSLDLAGSIHE